MALATASCHFWIVTMCVSGPLRLFKRCEGNSHLLSPSIRRGSALLERDPYIPLKFRFTSYPTVFRLWKEPLVYHDFMPADRKTAAMLTEDDFALFKSLIETAEKRSDGHVAVMKFTTNWRVAFETPSNRDDINGMAVGNTFGDAARKALGRK